MERPSLIHRLLRALWYATAGLVIAAAILFSVTRLLLPLLDGYRAELETRVSTVLGQPVHIRTMSARMERLTPLIVLEDVSLLDSSGTTAVARFSEARLGLNVVASLRRLRPVFEELTVLGADLTLVRQSNGSLRVQGLVSDASSVGATGDAAAGDGLTTWLLEQGRLALRNSRLHWRDLKSGRSFDLERVDIELRNRNDRHQLNLDVALPPVMGRSLRLALDLTGDVLQLSAWNGRAYVEGRGLKPAQWSEEWRAVAGITIQQGSADFKVWGSWQQGDLRQAVANLALQDLAVRGPGGAVQLRQLTTAARWQRDTTGWSLALDDWQLEPRAGAPLHRMQALLRNDGGVWQLQANELNLEDIALVAPLLPQLDAAKRTMLAEMRPTGMVRVLRVERAVDGLWHVQGTLERAAMQAWGKFPGFKGLSGRWVWHDDYGQIALDSHDISVSLPLLFRDTLQLQRLRGSVGIEHDVEGWRVALTASQVTTPDIHGTVDAVLNLPHADRPYLDLRTRFWDGRAVNAPRYLPAGIMGAGALAWLDQAFRAGVVTGGKALFHGPLDGFPFDAADGRFEVDFNARDAELFLYDGWPGLRKVDARVRFLNRSLLIEAERGVMYDSQINGARVAIDDLHHPMLNVQGTGRLRGPDAIALLRDTPLREHLGDFVTALRLDGESDVTLEFDLPLDDIARQERPFHLTGRAALQDNRLVIADLLSVDAIEGTLSFSEQGIAAEELQARLLDEPATIVIRGEGEGDDLRTVFSGHGQFQATALRQLMHSPLVHQVHGRSAWQGTLTVPHHAVNDGARLWLQSDLNGVTVALPHPLAKPAAESRMLELVHYFSGPQRGHLQLSYGDDFKLALALDDHAEWLRGAAHFGIGQAALPGDDVMAFSGALRNLDLARWAAALRGTDDQAGGSADNGGTTGGWHLPLRVVMDELHIAPPADTATEGTADTAQTLPSMDVRVARFGYGAAQLEQLAFQLRSTADVMELSDLRLSGPALQLSGQGRWQLKPRSYSELKLQLESPDFGKMVRGLGIASVITNGTAVVNAELNWPAPFQQYDVAMLGGSLHAKISDGRMDDVEPGAGRVVGLLSLQGLARRLLLDFRDLFGKGLVFSSIEGDIDIRAGDAYTSNLTMDTTSAAIRVEGRTGLAARDFDQHVTVVPNLSGTAPVVGTLAFGPQVGAALLLFQRLLKSNVDEAARSEYRVTGSWDEPKIEEVGKKPQAPPPIERDTL